MDPRLARVVRMVRSGVFGDPEDSAELMDALQPGRDYYLVGHDFPSYVDALDFADAAYANRNHWAAKTIRAATSMYAFSSDRTIKEYAEKVWNMRPAPFKPPHHVASPSPSKPNGGRAEVLHGGGGSRTNVGLGLGGLGPRRARISTESERNRHRRDSVD